MFEITDTLKVNWPVDVKKPIDGGKTLTQRFTAQFEIIDTEQLQQAIVDGDHLERVLIGWGDDIKGADGQPLPYTAENKQALLRIPYVRAAVMNAWVEASSGREAARKN